MSETEDTRTRLLKAAVRVIDAQGEVAIRVREIAAEADVREPSIYHFFGSREGLIEAAQAHRFAEGQRDIARQFDTAVRLCRSSDDLVAAFIVMLRHVFTKRAAERSARVSVLGSAQTRPGLAVQLLATQRVSGSMMADTISFAQRQGWIPADVDPLAFSMWFVGQITGRVLVEMAPDFIDGNHWNLVSTRAVLGALGLDPDLAVAVND